MTGHNYPDNLYADALAKDQAPVGAYRAPAEIPEAERKLRTALAYINHARDLIRDALGDNEPKAQREAKIAYDVACDKAEPERIPKWDPKWVETCPQRASHPMNAETIRQADEFGRDHDASGV